MYINVLNIKILHTQNYVMVSNILAHVWKIAPCYKTMFFMPLIASTMIDVIKSICLK
jgi:hypothetical protein